MTEVPQNYCVAWCNHTSSILNAFETLRANEVLTDVTLAAEGQLVRAHRVVLCACSSYFQEIFEYQPQKNVVVVLKDVPGEQLDALVQYMYKGQVQISQADLPAFFKTAHSLRINGIVQMLGSRNNVQEAPASIVPTSLLAEANAILKCPPASLRTSLSTSTPSASKRPMAIKVPTSKLNPGTRSCKVPRLKRGKKLTDVSKNGEINTPKLTQCEAFAIRALAEEFDAAEKNDETQESNVLDETGREGGEIDDSHHEMDVLQTSPLQGEMSYQLNCDECSFEAKTVVALKRHKRRMHKPQTGISRYKCDKCPKDYKQQEYLYRHQRYECGKAPKFACPHCSFRCFWRADYSKHLIRVHQDASGTLANETWRTASTL